MQRNDENAIITLMNHNYLSNQLWKNLETTNSLFQHEKANLEHEDINLYGLYDKSISDLHLSNLNLLNHWNSMLSYDQQLKWIQFVKPYQNLSIETDNLYKEVINEYESINLDHQIHIEWENYQNNKNGNELNDELNDNLIKYINHCAIFNTKLLAILKNESTTHHPWWKKIFEKR